MIMGCANSAGHVPHAICLVRTHSDELDEAQVLVVRVQMREADRILTWYIDVVFK